MSYGAAPTDENKVDVLKKQVNQVKDVMRQNIDKVNIRGEQIENLGETADSLTHDALLFEKKAKKLRRKKCWQNAKLWILLIYIIIIIILVLIGIIGGVAYYFIKNK